MNDLYTEIYEKLGIKNGISKKYKEVIKTVVDIIINPQKYKQPHQATVVPLETGGGKSSIANLTLAWLTMNDFNNAGTIILKERIEDCNNTVDDINSIAGQEVAIAYHNKVYYDTQIKKKYFKESELRGKLFKYPILVMTHEGFKRRLKKLGDFIYWTNDTASIDMSSSNKYLVRTRLIVDEQPTLMDIYQITSGRLSDIELYVAKTGNKKLMHQISSVCTHIRTNCFLKKLNLEDQYWYRYDFHFDNDFDEFILKCRNESIKDIYSALKIFCEEGGFVSYSDDERFTHITVARYIDIFDPLFNAIILDGTGRINAVYNNQYFNVVDMPQIKTYSNTSIFVCKQLNGSRNELATNKQILDASLSYIVKNVPSTEECLIITHKEFENYFIEMDLPSNVYINHYGNITGSNEYRNFKYGFYIGTPFMYDNAYKLAFHIYNKDRNYDKTHKVVTIKGVRKMVDEDYNNTKVSILAVELIQAINRIRCRNWNKGDTLETICFMINKDNDVMSLIEEGMPDVNIINDIDFYNSLPEAIKNHKTEYAIDILLRVIHECAQSLYYQGRAVAKNDLLLLEPRLNALSKSKKTDLWNSPEIKQLVSDKVIELKGRTVKFL